MGLHFKPAGSSKSQDITLLMKCIIKLAFHAFSFFYSASMVLYENLTNPLLEHVQGVVYTLLMMIGFSISYVTSNSWFWFVAVSLTVAAVSYSKSSF